MRSTKSKEKLSGLTIFLLIAINLISFVFEIDKASSRGKVNRINNFTFTRFFLLCNDWKVISRLVAFQAVNIKMPRYFASVLVVTLMLGKIEGVFKIIFNQILSNLKYCQRDWIEPVQIFAASILIKMKEKLQTNQKVFYQKALLVQVSSTAWVKKNTVIKKGNMETINSWNPNIAEKWKKHQ